MHSQSHESSNAAERELAQWWEKYLRERTRARQHTLQLFVRSQRPSVGTHAQRGKLFEQLRKADESNRIDEYDTRVLGDGVCLCQRCRNGFGERSLCETVLELATWRDGDVTSTGFLEREVDCEFTGEQYRIVVPPELAVGIYLDGSLAGVFPCAVERTQYGARALLTGLLEDLGPAEVSETSRRVSRSTP